MTEDFTKTAKGAAEKVSKQGEELTKTAAYKTISEVRMDLIFLFLFLFLFLFFIWPLNKNNIQADSMYNK